MPFRTPNLFRWSAAAALVACALGVQGCGDTKPSHSTPAVPAVVRGPEHRFAITMGGHSVQMRLAVEDAERAQGLMHITQMPEEEGMLFVWAKPQLMSFYMRNCRFPQDIGFFDASGTLREIHPMYPGVEDPVRSSAVMQFALELNQGWFARHEVKPGATIDLIALRDAMRERGFRPEKFFGVK